MLSNKVFLLFVIIACCLIDCFGQGTFRLPRRMMRHLPNHTIKILREHKCQLRSFSAREDRGWSRWTIGAFRCVNMKPFVLNIAICDRHCVDPVSCEKLNNSRNVPILHQLRIKKRVRYQSVSGNSTSPVEFIDEFIKLPIACICVPRNNRQEANCVQRQQTTAVPI